MDCDSSIFDALQRDDVLELLVQCIAQLPQTPKTVLAMYYHENLQPIEIAAFLALTECEIEQVRAETSGLLRTMLAAQLAELRQRRQGAAERPGVLPKVQKDRSRPRSSFHG